LKLVPFLVLLNLLKSIKDTVVIIDKIILILFAFRAGFQHGAGTLFTMGKIGATSKTSPNAMPHQGFPLNF